MRIDPKYFNLFIGICALVTIPVIIYSTLRYSQTQVREFEKKISAVRIDTLSFRSVSGEDSLHVNEIADQPVILHFWSTWSEKSKRVNEFLKAYSDNHENLTIIAAAVRDSDEQIMDYVEQNTISFKIVDGTDLFYSLLPPGIPSQIFIDNEKKLVDIHIGDDTLSIANKLNLLLKSE